MFLSIFVIKENAQLRYLTYCTQYFKHCCHLVSQMLLIYL